MMLDKITTIYKDDDLLVIDKPAGLLVHNPEGQNNPTVIDYILRRFPEIKNLDWPDPDRSGIVHRLDKDTSGLLMIAKNPKTLENLQNQFRARKIKKEYLALVFGKVAPKKGTIQTEISRHSSKAKQTIVPKNVSQSMLGKISKGKKREAETFYETIKNYTYKNTPLTLVKAKPKTGRMHQIRIHLKHLGFPIIGDPLYFFKPSKRLSKELGINRQFLHAGKIEFINPKTNDTLRLECDLPKDLQNILQKLESYNE